MKLNVLSDWIQALWPRNETLGLEVPPPSSDSIWASSYQSSAASIAVETKNQITLNQKQLAWDLSHPDIKTLEKLSALNSKRGAKGLAPIDLPKVTPEIESIQRDSKLSDKQKKEKIERFRKQLGLSKGEMKSLFTRRIEAACKKAEERLASFEQAKSERLKSELKQAEASFGKESARAKAIREKLDSLKSSLEPEKQRLKAEAKFFGSLYPSFFSKLGTAFRKIGQGLSKVLGVLSQVVRFLPALGPALSSALRSVQSLFQGKIGQFGKSLLGLIESAKQFLPLIPGAGAIANFAVSGIQTVIKASRSTKTL